MGKRPPFAHSLAASARVVPLLVLMVALFAPSAVLAQSQQTVLARGRDEIPAGELLFRIAESALPPGQPAVTHAHASGFDYAIEGTHVLTVDGIRQLIPEGRAAWVGTLQEHTHGDLNNAGMRFWFFAVRPATTRGVPGMWPYPGSRIRSESEDFGLETAGTHDLVLSEIRLPRPGDAAGPLAQRGPVGITVVEGQVSLGGRVIPSEGVVIQWPDSQDRLVNTGTGPARLLALAVMPAGTVPAQLPRTGGLPPLLWVTAAAGALLISGLALERSRRTGQTKR